MPNLNYGPVVAALAPYIAVILGSALALLGVAIGLRVAKREMVRRRRPVHASSKRSMIVVNGSGSAVLHGNELHVDDELQVKVAVWNEMHVRKSQWVNCRLSRDWDGTLVLVLPNNHKLPAAGQMARWPLEVKGKKHRPNSEMYMPK